MVWHQLYVNPATHVLGARVTLSNLPYVGDNEPRVDEPFDFVFLAFTSIQRSARCWLVLGVVTK